MNTKIDLCSMALLKLGESPIQSLLDDTPAAQLGRTLFDPVIDALLASHPWHFVSPDNEFLLTAYHFFTNCTIGNFFRGIPYYENSMPKLQAFPSLPKRRIFFLTSSLIAWTSPGIRSVRPRPSR